MYGDDIIKSDIPVLKQLIDVYEEKDCNVIGVQEVDRKLVYKYGIIEYADEFGKIKRLVEKPTLEEAPSNDAGLGRYIVKPEIFEELEHLEKGACGEYQFSDAMLTLMQKQDFYACRFNGKYFDIGNQLGYLKANVEYALDRDDIKEDFKKYLVEKLKNN